MYARNFVFAVYFIDFISNTCFSLGNESHLQCVAAQVVCYAILVNIYGHGVGAIYFLKNVQL